MCGTTPRLSTRWTCTWSTTDDSFPYDRHGRGARRLVCFSHFHVMVGLFLLKRGRQLQFRPHGDGLIDRGGREHELSLPATTVSPLDMRALYPAEIDFDSYACEIIRGGNVCFQLCSKRTRMVTLSRSCRSCAWSFLCVVCDVPQGPHDEGHHHARTYEVVLGKLSCVGVEHVGFYSGGCC